MEQYLEICAVILVTIATIMAIMALCKIFKDIFINK